MKLCEYESAIVSFKQSLEMAKTQGDVAAEKAITKALDDVNNRFVEYYVYNISHSFIHLKVVLLQGTASLKAYVCKK